MRNKSTACRCISSMRSIVYHQRLAVVSHQAAGKIHAMAWWYTAPKGLMICTALRAAMIYQAYGNPQSSASSLRGTPTAAWINKKGTFGRQKFLFCWCGRQDLNLHGVPPVPKTGASTIPPRPQVLSIIARKIGFVKEKRKFFGKPQAVSRFSPFNGYVFSLRSGSRGKSKDKERYSRSARE